MSTRLAVNFPVKDLAKSSRFFAELGFSVDQRLADDNRNALVVNDDTYVLLLMASSFKTIIKRDIPDATSSTERSFRDLGGHHWDVFYIDPATLQERA